MILVCCMPRKYIVPDISKEIYDFIGVPTGYDHDKNNPQAARDFYENHNGWEHKWPLKIRLLDTENKPLGDFIVDVELEPNFIAKRVE